MPSHYPVGGLLSLGIKEEPFHPLLAEEHTPVGYLHRLRVIGEKVCHFLHQAVIQVEAIYPLQLLYVLYVPGLPQLVLQLFYLGLQVLHLYLHAFRACHE